MKISKELVDSTICLEVCMFRKKDAAWFIYLLLLCIMCSCNLYWFLPICFTVLAILSQQGISASDAEVNSVHLVTIVASGQLCRSKSFAENLDV